MIGADQPCIVLHCICKKITLKKFENSNRSKCSIWLDCFWSRCEMRPVCYLGSQWQSYDLKCLIVNAQVQFFVVSRSHLFSCFSQKSLCRGHVKFCKEKYVHIVKPNYCTVKQSLNLDRNNGLVSEHCCQNVFKLSRVFFCKHSRT